MTVPIIPGEPIDPNKLEKIISDYLVSIRNKVKNFIPLGSIFATSFSAVKTFITRPKVLNQSYSNRTQLANNQVDLGQLNVSSTFLGTPYTLGLGQNLGIALSGSQVIDGQSPTYKKEDVYPYNPSTDYLYGGLPFKGNSPFVFNNFLGWSNNIEDLNLRILPGTDGYSLNFRAKRLSLLIRETSASAFVITDDSFPNLSDRKNIELINSTNINLTIASTAGAFIASTAGATSGYFPTVPSVSGDYGLWVVKDNVNNLENLVMTSWSSDYTTVNGIVSTPHTNWYGSNARHKYIRCVGCVYVEVNGTDRKFNVSKKQAWGETSASYNANPYYGQIYQQITSPNPVIRQFTSVTDRRIIPSQYYMEGSNSFLLSRVTYSGLVRHIPGCGSSKLKLRMGLDGATNTTRFDFGNLELTNSTQSIWLSGNLVLPNFQPASTTVCFVDDGAAVVNGSAYYFWLTANPKSILDTASNAPNNNLRLKLVLSKSPTWSGLSAVFKSANPNYDYRARVGWFVAGTNNTVQTQFEMNDGVYKFKHGIFGNSLKSPQNVLINGSSTNAITWQSFSLADKLPTSTTGSAAQIKWLEGFAVMSNNGTQFTETLSVTTTTFGGSNGATASTAGTGAAVFLKTFSGGTSVSHVSQSFKFPVTSTDEFFYNTSGGGTGAAIKEVIYSSFYLPITYI
jgi:hypothetical protein